MESDPDQRSRFPRIIVLMVVLLIVAFGVYRWRLSARVDAALAAIRAAGDPATVADIQSLMLHVAPDRNAAIKLHRLGEQLNAAIAAATPRDTGVTGFPPGAGYPGPSFPHADALVEDTDSEQPIIVLPYISNDSPDVPLEQIDDDLRIAIGRFTTSYAALLDEVRAASRISDAEYPKDFSRTAFDGWHRDGFGNVRSTARCLALASLDRAIKGDPQGSRQDVHAILRIAATLADEPTLLPRLVHHAINAEACDAAEQLISRVELSEVELEELARAFAESQTPRGMRNAMVTERVHVVDAAVCDAARPLFNRSPADIAAFGGGRDRAILELLTIMNGYVAAAELDPHNRIAAAKSTATTTPSTDLVNVFLPSFDRAFVIDLWSLAELRMVRTAILVERHRIQTGSLPTPSELIEIDEHAIDPFNGEPLGYAPAVDGSFKVYSVGEDGIDDGGKRRSLDPSDGDATFDIVFEVRPELRERREASE